MNDNRSPAAEPRRFVTPKQLLLAALFFLFFAWMISWKFALILMGSLLIHEFGHAAAMLYFGCGVKGFYFLPPLGLAVVPLEPWKSRWAETVIALMGPAWGFILGLACLGLYFLTGEPIFAGVAAFNGFLNLFNLLPINPVDGGRVVKSLAYSISPKVGLAVLVLGLIGTAALGYYIAPLVAVFIGFMGYLELKQEIRAQRQQRDRELVVAAFAEKLGVEPNVPAISDALEGHFRDIDGGLVDWNHLLADDQTDLRRRLLSQGFTPHDVLKLAWTVIAVDAIEPSRSLLTGKEVYATSEQELWAVPDDQGFTQTPLGKFLAAKPLPAMRLGQLTLGFAAYAALALGLLTLLALASQFMNLTDLIKILS